MYTKNPLQSRHSSGYDNHQAISFDVQDLLRLSTASRLYDVLMTVPLFSDISLMAHTPMNVPSSLLLHLPVTKMPQMMLKFGERQRSYNIG